MYLIIMFPGKEVAEMIVISSDSDSKNADGLEGLNSPVYYFLTLLHSRIFF